MVVRKPFRITLRYLFFNSKYDEQHEMFKETQDVVAV